MEFSLYSSQINWTPRLNERENNDWTIFDLKWIYSILKLIKSFNCQNCYLISLSLSIQTIFIAMMKSVWVLFIIVFVEIFLLLLHFMRADNWLMPSIYFLFFVGIYLLKRFSAQTWIVLKHFFLPLSIYIFKILFRDEKTSYSLRLHLIAFFRFACN